MGHNKKTQEQTKIEICAKVIYRSLEILKDTPPDGLLTDEDMMQVLIMTGASIIENHPSIDIAIETTIHMLRTWQERIKTKPKED